MRKVKRGPLSVACLGLGCRRDHAEMVRLLRSAVEMGITSGFLQGKGGKLTELSWVSITIISPAPAPRSRLVLFGFRSILT